MRKIAIGLAVALIAVLFASCSANVQETGVIPSLTIRAVDGTSKALIGYDGTGAVDSETGITHYTIGVTASDGSVLLSPSSYLPSSSPMYMLTNVISGTYTFTVAGYIEMTDGSYTKIAESSETLAVSPSKPEVEIVLDDFVSGVSKALTIDVVLPQDFTGNGSYSGTLSWEIREGVGLTGAVADSGTETISWTDADTSKTITLYADKASSLTGGRYTFISTLTDSGTGSVGTEKKAIGGIRILPGLPASGSISFLQTEITDSTVTVVDKLGNEIELTGSEGVIDVNEDGSVSVTVTGLPEGSAIHWYLNGEETSAAVSGDTYTLTGLPGGDSLVEVIVVDGTTSGIGYIAFQCNKVVIQISKHCEVGDEVTIGGVDCVIAYDAGSEQEWGRYILCEKNDLHYYTPGLGSGDVNGDYSGKQWGDFPHDDSVTINNSIGAGKANTDYLISYYTSSDYLWYYVKQHRDQTGVDWHVPSLEELSLLYDNREMIGNFSTSSPNNYNYYWSSSSIGDDDAYYVLFSTGMQNLSVKDTVNTRVRCVVYATAADLRAL